MVYGLFMADFVSWFVIVYGMSKKNIFKGYLVKRKIRTIKGLFS